MSHRWRPKNQGKKIKAIYVIIIIEHIDCKWSLHLHVGDPALADSNNDDYDDDDNNDIHIFNMLLVWLVSLTYSHS